jgi:hypothetical protein
MPKIRHVALVNRHLLAEPTPTSRYPSAPPKGAYTNKPQALWHSCGTQCSLGFATAWLLCGHHVQALKRSLHCHHVFPWLIRSKTPCLYLRLAFQWLSLPFPLTHDVPRFIEPEPSRPFKYSPCRFYAMTPVPNSNGSGGLLCTPRMSALIAKAGSSVLSTFEGGQELRGLYQKSPSYISFRTFVMVDPCDTFTNSHRSIVSSFTQWICQVMLPG